MRQQPDHRAVNMYIEVKYRWKNMGTFLTSVILYVLNTLFTLFPSYIETYLTCPFGVFRPSFTLTNG